MTNSDRIRDLLAKFQRNTMAPQDKKEAEQIAKEYGVKIRRSKCKNCYTDALVECYRLSIRAEERATPSPIRYRYRYKLSCPVRVDGYGTYSADSSRQACENLRLRNPQLFWQIFDREEVVEENEPATFNGDEELKEIEAKEEAEAEQDTAAPATDEEE